MTITNRNLKRRIIEISYKNKLSHLGSNLTAVDIIKEIYDKKKPEEKFILSSGHAGLALYVVIEEKMGKKADEIFHHHGVHPDRCKDCYLDCSTGSLGMGLPIAVGMALADRTKNVYCLISDGECAEGSIYEAMRIKTELEIPNLKVYINVNGWSAYQPSNDGWIYHNYEYLADIRETNVDDFPFLVGQDAHYATLTEETYKQAIEILK